MGTKFPKVWYLTNILLSEWNKNRKYFEVSGKILHIKTHGFPVHRGKFIDLNALLGKGILQTEHQWSKCSFQEVRERTAKIKPKGSVRK